MQNLKELMRNKEGKAKKVFVLAVGLLVIVLFSVLIASQIPPADSVGIVNDPNGDYITFTNDFASMNIRLLKEAGDSYEGFSDIFVEQNGDGYKFGGNDATTTSGEISTYKYRLESSKPIEELGYGVYIVRENEDVNCYENPFEEPTCDDPKFVFDDIIYAYEFGAYTGDSLNYTCTLDDVILNNTDCPVIFDPEASFTFTDESNTTLELEFKAKHNDSLGFTSIDPTITFSSNLIRSIEMAVSDNNEIVIAYCDETEDDDSFVTYTTNGTLLFGPQDLDTSGGSCVGDMGNSVAILADDLAAFVYTDRSNRVEYIQRPYKSSTFVTTRLVESSSSGHANSVTRISNNISMVAWYFTSFNGAMRIQLFDKNGAIGSHYVIDGLVGSSANGIDIDANNETLVSVIYFDDDANDIKFAVLKHNFTAVFNETDVVQVDALDGTDGDAVSIAALNDTVSILAYNFFAAVNPGNVAARPYLINGTPLHPRILPDGSIGLDTSISVSIKDSSEYVVGWFDNTAGSGNEEIEFRSFLINGTATHDTITVASSQGPAVEVVSERFHTNLGICQSNIVLARASKPLGFPVAAKFDTFLSNGTVWNGLCPTSCEYGGGNWNIDCSDNCVISENVAGDAGANVTISGEGTFTLDNADITGFDDYIFKKNVGEICEGIVINGGSFG